MPTHMLAVCDRCKLAHDLFFNVENDEHFIREHHEHNFAGLRVIAESAPGPRRHKAYATTDELPRPEDDYELPTATDFVDPSA